MKRFILVIVTLITIGMWVTGDAWARGGGGRGGGGGGGRGGGGGAYRGGGGGGGRSAAARTPSISRPSGGGGRPGGGYAGARPGGSSRPSGGSRPGGARPGGGSSQVQRPQGNRPSLGTLPTPSRPGTGISQRPGGPGGGSARPGGSSWPNLAGGPGGAGTRPGGGGRPSQGQLNDFLDLGGSGSRPSFQRPSTRPGSAGGPVAGGAANDFLRDRRGTFPGGSTRPGGVATRPGTGDLAGGGRPGRPGGGDLGPGRPGEGTRPGDPTRPGGDRPGRPGTGEGGNRPGRPGGGEDGNRPGRPGENGNRPGRPGDGDRPGRPGDRPDRPGDRPDWANRPNQRPDRNPNWNQSQNWRRDRWSHVNNRWRDNWNHYDRWFYGNWWNNSPYWRFNNNFNYWGWATWPAITAWFPWGWSQPVYYNYGNNVYYEDDMVYYGTTPVATAADYAYQAEQIATSVPENAPPANSWMPLGVFALTADGEADAADPTMFLQLAVSKEGVIAGTLKNTVSGTTKNVEGMVDRETQRAAWTEVGQTRPIMETGISNLTEDTTPVLVHYADGTTQQWLLVRMDQPPKDAAGAASPAGEVPATTPPQ